MWDIDEPPLHPAAGTLGWGIISFYPCHLLPQGPACACFARGQSCFLPYAVGPRRQHHHSSPILPSVSAASLLPSQECVQAGWAGSGEIAKDPSS